MRQPENNEVSAVANGTAKNLPSPAIKKLSAALGVLVATNLCGCESDELPTIPYDLQSVDGGEAGDNDAGNFSEASAWETGVDVNQSPSDDAATTVDANTADAANDTNVNDCGSLTACNGVCTDLMYDKNNCGSCGKTCQESCFDGNCVSNECLPPNSICGATCTDLKTDPENCGQCNWSCGGAECVDGNCQ
ncbi:MAG TPA: hypothetical protein P5229_03175 [Candidatus Gracilibacteria bacterium]|nr:hypothetical protein [Candidatus Gracilibacteria bacterium]